MTFRLAAQESTLPGDTLVEKFSFTRDCGFDGIELGGSGQRRLRRPGRRAARGTPGAGW